MIFVGNFFTIFVFWIHRHKLKRTSFLLINLAVSDLLVGLTDLLSIGTYALPRHIRRLEIETKIMGPSFLAAFSGTSMFFLVIISLERALASIWPLRHRVASTKTCIYSAVIVWLAGITVGALSFLILYGIFHLRYYVLAFSIMIGFSLVTICMSYLVIRTMLNHGDAAIDMARNRQSVEQNTKLSRTMFLVIGASVVFWVPGLAIHCIYYFVPGLFPVYVKYIFTMSQLTNSLVNPIIYSLRILVFRETLKRLKNKIRIRKQSKRYTVNKGA